MASTPDAYYKEIVQSVSTETLYAQKVVKRVLDATLKEIRSTVARGRKVRLPGFGTFYAGHRPASKGRNLRNKDQVEIVDVPAMNLPKFRPGAIFKKAVRGKKR